MKWSNLKANKCPRCGKDLIVHEMAADSLLCKCGFRISHTRAKEIISDQVMRGIDQKHYRPKDEISDVMP